MYTTTIMKIVQFFFIFALPVLCQQGTTPFITGSIFGFANDRSQVKTQGIHIDPVMGSQVEDGYIQFPIVKGDLSYGNGPITGNLISFDGGARFIEQAAPDASFTFTNFVLDFNTGKVTATMDSKANFPFGTIDLSSMTMYKMPGESIMSFSPSYLQMLLDSDMLTTINTKFTTKLQVENHLVPITLTLVVDLLSGGNVNTALIQALQLDQYVDISGGVQGLRNTDFNLAFNNKIA